MKFLHLENSWYIRNMPVLQILITQIAFKKNSFIFSNITKTQNLFFNNCYKITRNPSYNQSWTSTIKHYTIFFHFPWILYVFFPFKEFEVHIEYRNSLNQEIFCITNFLNFPAFSREPNKTRKKSSVFFFVLRNKKETKI